MSKVPTPSTCGGGTTHTAHVVYQVEAMNAVHITTTTVGHTLTPIGLLLAEQGSGGIVRRLLHLHNGEGCVAWSTRTPPSQDEERVRAGAMT